MERIIPQKKKISKLTAALTLATTILTISLIVAYKIRLREKERLRKFYTSPHALDNYNPGDVIRIEPLKVPLPNGKGYRILYVSEMEKKNVAVSGIVCIPSKKYLSQKRIVTWAHGTIGMGEECAPSRSTNPFIYMSWAGQMMKKGWVIAATDYYGLGTEGIERYMIGRDQGRDVLNATRAALSLTSFGEKNPKTIIFGHSQGGQAAIFAGNMSQKYAPELGVKGIATASPALELKSLLAKEYDTAVAWAIGPEIAIAWPEVYKDLDIKEVLSETALHNYKRIAKTHILQEYPEAILRNRVGQHFFKKDPTKIDSWIKAFEHETPRIPTLPLLVVQSTSDTIVLPETTDEFVKRAKAQGANIDTITLTNIDHNLTPLVAGKKIIEWMDKQFKTT